MAKSSINFQQVKELIKALKHNDRTDPPRDYFLPPKYHKGNEVWNDAEIANEIVAELHHQSIISHKKKFGQKLQAKSYLWEAVVNLNSDHTMADLEELRQAIEEETGFTTVQIAIHRDEGRINERGYPVHNYHAHMVFYTLDPSTGEQLYRRRLTKRQKEQRPDLKPMNKARMSKLQDITANVLRMKRGKRGSKAVHYSPTAYGKHKDQERKLENYYAEIERLQLSIVEAKKELEELREILEEQHEEITYLQHRNTQGDVYEANLIKFIEELGAGNLLENWLSEHYDDKILDQKAENEEISNDHPSPSPDPSPYSFSL